MKNAVNKEYAPSANTDQELKDIAIAKNAENTLSYSIAGNIHTPTRNELAKSFHCGNTREMNKICFSSNAQNVEDTFLRLISPSRRIVGLRGKRGVWIVNGTGRELNRGNKRSVFGLEKIIGEIRIISFLSSGHWRLNSLKQNNDKKGASGMLSHRLMAGKQNPFTSKNVNPFRARPFSVLWCQENSCRQ